MSESLPAPVYTLMREVLADTKLTPEQKIKLLRELRRGNLSGYERWAIYGLATAVVLAVVGLVVVAWGGAEEVADGLIAIGSAAAGGLAGLLTPGRGRGGDGTTEAAPGTDPTPAAPASTPERAAPAMPPEEQTGP